MITVTSTRLVSNWLSSSGPVAHRHGVVAMSAERVASDETGKRHRTAPNQAMLGNRRGGIGGASRFETARRAKESRDHGRKYEFVSAQDAGRGAARRTGERISMPRGCAHRVSFPLSLLAAVMISLSIASRVNDAAPTRAITISD